MVFLELCALRERDIATFNNQGTQRAFLSSLESAGPLALLKPSQLFILSLNLGLSPLFLEVPCKTSPSIVSNYSKYNRCLKYLICL